MAHMGSVDFLLLSPSSFSTPVIHYFIDSWFLKTGMCCFSLPHCCCCYGDNQASLVSNYFLWFLHCVTLFSSLSSSYLPKARVMIGFSLDSCCTEEFNRNSWLPVLEHSSWLLHLLRKNTCYSPNLPILQQILLCLSGKPSACQLPL